MNNLNVNQAEHGITQRAKILKALETRTMTTRQVADHLGISRSQACRYIGQLREPVKRMFILDHFTVRGNECPIYALGDEPDAVPVFTERREQPRPEVPAPEAPVPAQSWLSALGM